MAPEQRTEQCKGWDIARLRQVPQAEPGQNADTVRLRQVPPVIADRVTDPMRSGLRESDE